MVDVVRTGTPVRELGQSDPQGFRLLRDVGSSYLDGAEEQVLHIVTGATDVSSGSDELIVRAKGWAQRYHLDPTRANIIRSIDLPPDARVLEIGAGCGAVSRYLGEQCALVDALEPVPARAAVAAARTRDLDSVQVLVGEIDDVPDEPTYDLIVVIGVLEYVGAGSADRAPYLDFLSKITSRLVDGGTLALAIENQLGVKYLAGSPEDHTNRPFDSLEGYPHGGPAHTFSRSQLESLFVDAGLQPVTRIAFPDYKLTRTVLGDVPEHARSLMWTIPRLPSPDWRAARPKGVAEGPLWRTLVEAGLGNEFGNSFLVLGGKGAQSSLWPDNRAAVFYSVRRSSHLAMQTFVERDEHDELWLRRRRLIADDGSRGATLAESDVRFVAGTDFPEVLARRGVHATGALLRRWVALVDAGLADGSDGLIDLVPHNLVVDAGGELHPIDIELTGFPVTREQVLGRGVLWLAYNAAPLAPPWRWRPATTVGELARELGSLVGLPADGLWLDRVLADELPVQERLRPMPADVTREQWLGQLAGELSWVVDRALVEFPLGDRLADVAARTASELATQKAEVKRLRATVQTQTQELQKVRRALRSLRSSRAVRASRSARAAVERALPAGTTRRAVAARAVRAVRSARSSR